jgi:hypothetical protein
VSISIVELERRMLVGLWSESALQISGYRTLVAILSESQRRKRQRARAPDRKGEKRSYKTHMDSAYATGSTRAGR